MDGTQVVDSDVLDTVATPVNAHLFNPARSITVKPRSPAFSVFFELGILTQQPKYKVTDSFKCICQKICWKGQVNATNQITYLLLWQVDCDLGIWLLRSWTLQRLVQVILFRSERLVPVASLLTQTHHNARLVFSFTLACRGYRVLSHGGALDGHYTQMYTLPDVDLGVYMTISGIERSDTSTPIFAYIGRYHTTERTTLC